MITFDRISFNHFYTEIKNIIPKEWFALINPETQSFWKCENVYYALTVGDGKIHINMIIEQNQNNIQGLRGLIKQCKFWGIKTLTFGTASDNLRMQKLYKYIGATHLNTIKNAYGVGDSWEEYSLDLTTAKRFK